MYCRLCKETLKRAKDYLSPLIKSSTKNGIVIGSLKSEFFTALAIDTHWYLKFEEGAIGNQEVTKVLKEIRNELNLNCNNNNSSSSSNK